MVTFRDWRSGSYGYSIRIDHGNGYQTWYSHLNDFSVNLYDDVTAGQQIGLSGNSGQDQPYHLHFEVRHDGDETDPFGWRGDWPDPLGETAICLWGDGQCSEIAVEDGSSHFYDYEYGPEWQWDCHGNGWTMLYLTNEETGPAYTYARWRPDLPHDGPYSVSAFVPAIHATTANATYRVSSKNGDHYVTIIQNDYSDEWVSLGGYDFWDGIVGYVRLDGVTGEDSATTEVGFDTVKARYFGSYIPVMLKNYP
jgi:hypothetical protein